MGLLVPRHARAPWAAVNTSVVPGAEGHAASKLFGWPHVHAHRLLSPG